MEGLSGKTAVVTACFGPAGRYGALTEAAARAYCARHGYAFVPLKDFSGGLPPAWGRLSAALEALRAGAALVLWLDADALILNPEVKAEALLPAGTDIGLAADLDGLRAGAMLFRAGDFARAVLEAALEKVWELAGPAEALRAVYAESGAGRERFALLEPRALCAGVTEYGFEDFIMHAGGLGCLAKYRVLKSLHSRVYGRGRERLTAMHGGDMGDVIYSVPLFRELGVKRVLLDPQSPYRTKMNPAACAAIKPLLERQGFSVEVRSDGPDAGVDLYTDIFREGAQDMENNHLSVTNSEKLARGLDLSKKYLEAEPRRVADVVVNRSSRYRNPDFDWLYLLGGLPERITAAFIGVKAEYDAFCRLTGLGNSVFYYPTADLHEAARAIAGAKVFVGNQSSPYAIAEGLKVNRIQETCLYTPNCRAQSYNGIDVKSRADLYGARVKLFEWLGLSEPVAPPAKRALLYTACGISDEKQFGRVCEWLDYYLPRLGKLGATGVALVDDGSPLEWLAALQARYPGMETSVLRPLPEGRAGYEIPAGLASAQLALVTFPDRLGRPTENLLPGWWRSYSFGAVLAEALNYEKFIFIETDAYIYSDRLFNWAADTASGFNSLYSRTFGVREPAVQVCARSEFPRAAAYFGRQEPDVKFWWGEGLTPRQYLPEHALQFTNRLDEVKQFRFDRYGNDRCGEVPPDADGCCDLAGLGPAGKQHRREARKRVQHAARLEAAKTGEPELS